ncbi:MAG: pyrimidine 5'-nucleotidase [Chloroflexi bacterium]|nr:pyrimidine 5'-nucleotidase [Chloroflexota bacterium]
MTYELIIFDLDNTLYDGDSGLLQELGRRIRIWLQTHLNLEDAAAQALQHEYHRLYGTTMGGLIVEHPDLDIHDYLQFVHDIPVEDYLQPDQALAQMLVSLPLRKIVYTNATSEYGWRVLAALDVQTYFERVVGIEEVELRNKIYSDAYGRMLDLVGVEPDRCIMVEDWVSNLQAAKALGMVTVLVGEEPAEHVDFCAPDILQVGRIVKSLLDGAEQPGDCSS